jgi:hypothetical protein
MNNDIFLKKKIKKNLLFAVSVPLSSLHGVHGPAYMLHFFSRLLIDRAGYTK